eukprot:scaffold2534_cov260-Pinguiococcus_pyrenoidosus.AAC.27
MTIMRGTKVRIVVDAYGAGAFFVDTPISYWTRSSSARARSGGPAGPPSWAEVSSGWLVLRWLRKKASA